MHTEKIKIFDEYAQSKGYIDWNNLNEHFQDGLMDSDEFLIFMLDACDMLQENLQKRILDNMNWDRCKNKGSECRTDKHELSILSENNLIK